MDTIRAWLVDSRDLAHVLAAPSSRWTSLLKELAETLPFAAPPAKVRFPLERRTAQALEPLDFGSSDPLDAAELQASLILLAPLGLVAEPLVPDDLEAPAHARWFSTAACAALTAGLARSQAVESLDLMRHLQGLLTETEEAHLPFALALDTVRLLARVDPAWQAGGGLPQLASSVREALSDEGVFAPLLHGFPPSPDAIEAWLAARWHHFLKRLPYAPRALELFDEVDRALRRTWELVRWAERATTQGRLVVFVGL